MEDRTMERIGAALRRHWGYDRFLPLQREAMASVLGGRDSLVVLPTGGGKSLCYQAPAVAMEGTAVVVSPLISLMKDQVDALLECGVPAARLDSSQSTDERREVLGALRDRTLKLLYVAPERLVANGFAESLRRIRPSFIAVDEAHCVSMWGHDFRPEYRQLGVLKQVFPGIAVHAYTATATQTVRDDIAAQLGLEDPEVLVGSFDRPNLVYRVERRTDVQRQVRAVLERYKGESGIVYCIRRADVDRLCAELGDLGYSAAPYHAGMDDAARKRSQEAFSAERVNTIVATVAFGMGIDKSNVRYVVHTGMPKSLEHYQQESGRAGRDGLEAECVLLYSGGDYGVWSRLVGNGSPEAREIALGKLGRMYDYCTGVTCRHRALVEYFGQRLERDRCDACDVCLGDLECMADPLRTAQMILSCVVRLGRWAGPDYTSLVLAGSQEQRIRDAGHHTLSTYGLLADHPKRVIRDWIEQLAGQGLLCKTGDYNILGVTDSGRRLLKGEGAVRLLKPAEKAKKVSRAAADSWDGVDRELFEALRILRREIATARGVPAYVVFTDAALRDMARRRPSSREQFLEVSGVGEKKCKQYADDFLALIARQRREAGQGAAR